MISQSTIDGKLLKKGCFEFANVFFCHPPSRLFGSLAPSTASILSFLLPSPCETLTLSNKNMTAIVDSIDSAADKISDGEYLADQKRVTYSFHQPRPSRSHIAT